MFNYIAKCFSQITKRESRDIKLLMLGIDNAGKSTIINDLKGEAKELTVPTVGFSNAEFRLLNFKVTAYDVGGGPRIRGIWKDYYAEIFGAVYVIDASDRERITESRTVLREAFSDVRLAGKPFVVFANKQDIDGALSEEDVEVQFELAQLAKKSGSQYKVFQCTALLNGGRKVDSQLKKGLSWLLQTMNEDFPSLQERVLKDIEVQKEADKKERAERLERVRKYREEREKAEREKEAAKENEKADSDDDDVVFGNVLPRVKDLSKAKTETKIESPTKKDDKNRIDTVQEEYSVSNKMDFQANSHAIAEEPLSGSNQQINEHTKGVESSKKKRKKKRKAKRNQTVPSDDGENSDAGMVLKPIAWKTPPPSLTGFPGNGRKLEPIRAPLHNNLYSPSNLSLISDESDKDKLNNGHFRSVRPRPRPNEEDCDVIT